MKAEKSVTLGIPTDALASESYPPGYRLHYSWEYRKFFGSAEVLRLSTCVLFRIPNDRGHFRLGVTVKARVNSVQRNRVKRRLREGFRRLKADLGSFDYNVVISGHRKVTPEYLEKLAESLKGELTRALRAASS